jgi:hypothetical protein
MNWTLIQLATKSVFGFFPNPWEKKYPAGHVCIATVIEFQANFSIITPYLPYKVARLSACLSCTVPGYIDG